MTIQTDRQTETKRWRETERKRDREREENFRECRMVPLINHLFFQFIPKVWYNTRS